MQEQISNLLKHIQRPALRHALSIGMVLLIAAYCDLFLSFSHEYWISLIAVLVCQTTREKSSRQGMIVFLICLVAALSASILKITILNIALLYFIISAIFILGDYVIYLNRLFSNKILLLVIFVLIWLIAGLPPVGPSFMIKDRLIDMMSGALIGLLGAHAIFPVKVYDEFRLGIVPILQTLVDYSKHLNEYFKQPENFIPKDLDADKNIMQMALHKEEKTYPEWVYESGFNRELRSGYRYFLVHLEWLTETFVSIHYLLRSINVSSIALLSPALTESNEKNQELLEILIQYFKEGEIKKDPSDFRNDISQLENTLKKHVPNSLELLDISPEYLQMTSLVSAIKNLRSILLQLLVSLPTHL
jgi:hypothetical protein